MSFTFQFTPSLDRQLNQVLMRFSRMTGKDARKPLKTVARGAATDLMLLTPPNTGASALKTTFAQHKRAGEAAIKADVRKVARPFKRKWINAAQRSSPDSQGRQKLFVDKQGQVVMTRTVITSQAQYEREHERARNKRTGRTKGAGSRIRKEEGRVRVVENAVSTPDYNRYYKQVSRDRLGTAKSGWRRFAALVGKAVPKWVAGKKGIGGARLKMKHDWPIYEFWNGVPYAQKWARRIMPPMMRNRIGKLKAQMANFLKSRARRFK